jgi:hypothetical protein
MYINNDKEYNEFKERLYQKFNQLDNKRKDIIEKLIQVKSNRQELLFNIRSSLNSNNAITIDANPLFKALTDDEQLLTNKLINDIYYNNL